MDVQRASDLLRLPLTGPPLLARALDDLNAIAEKARAQPDAVTEIKALLDLDSHAVQIVDGGRDLVEVARSLDEN